MNEQAATRSDDDKPAGKARADGREVRDHAMFDAEISGAVLNLALLRRLLKWLAPYKVTVAISTVLVITASVLQVMLPVILSIVAIDYILSGNANPASPDLGLIALNQWLSEALGWAPLLAAALMYVVFQVSWAILGHWHRMTLNSAVINGLRDLRMDLFSHLESRPASFYDRVAVGRIMTRVTNDVEALYEALRGLGTLVGEFVPFFVALGIMFATDVELTLWLLLALPIMGTITAVFRRFSREFFRRARLALSSLNQNMQENLSGLTVVQISGREEENLSRYVETNAQHRNSELASARIETLYGAFTDSMSHIALGVIVWLGTESVAAGAMSLGGVVLFTRFIDMLFQPIVALGEQTNILFRAMASGERIFQALDWDERIHEPSDPTTLPPRLRGELEFRDLTFAYDYGETVLHNVSLTIPAGERLAIVGPTGSGKSTLIRLLARFYDFPNGKIFLDGFDLNQIHSHDLRKRVGVVLQDFHIFSGSIYDNISLGDPTITRERAIDAAKTVNAWRFISDLPNGMDTELSERGQNLSQGQRQLLAFARVLAADPEILVLDEATASIDTATELLIQDALDRLTEGRTSIIIAHRLQTIAEADRILVLEDGRVKETGSHDELLAQGGLYSTLYSLQFQSDDTSDEQAAAEPSQD